MVSPTHPMVEASAVCEIATQAGTRRARRGGGASAGAGAGLERMK